MDFHVGFEGQQSRPSVSPSFFPIAKAGFEQDTKGGFKADAEFKISPSHPKAYTFSSRNFYQTLASNEDETHASVSAGRRLIGWSLLDEMWGLGTFEPLDSWDRLRAFPQGLTGFFAAYETSALQFQFFASYLFLPELAPPVIIENSRFVLHHPQSISSTPQTINLLNRPTPLGYQIVTPKTTRVIFRPSLAFQVQSKNQKSQSENWFGKFSYGYLPLNYFPVALQASLFIPLNQILVQLHPRLLHHHLFNSEIAYRSESFSSGLTGLVDIPTQEEIPSDYNTAPLITSSTLSPWIKFHFPQTTLLLSHLWTAGGIKGDVGPYANANSSIFSSRMLYRNATQFGLNFELNPSSPHRPRLELKEIHDYSILADWISADVYYSLLPNFTVFIGGDLIAAQRNSAENRGAEFLADLKTNDRLRAGATYVF